MLKLSRKPLRCCGGWAESQRGSKAKRAVGGMPKSVRETLSAFANTDGGTILLGVDEASGFSLVELTNPPALRDALVQMSRDDITPPLQISVEVVEVEDRWLVVAEVPPAPADRRPVRHGPGNLGRFLRARRRR